MSQIGELVDDVRRLSKTFRPLTDLEKALDGVKDIDKEVDKLNARLAQAKADTVTADASLVASKARLAASQEAEKVQQARSAEALGLAEEKANEIERVAAEDAQSMREQGTRDAEQTVAAATREVQRIKTTILGHQDVLETLVQQTTDQQAVLASVNQQIADVKRSFAAIR